MFRDDDALVVRLSKREKKKKGAITNLTRGGDRRNKECLPTVKTSEGGLLTQLMLFF